MRWSRVRVCDTTLYANVRAYRVGPDLHGYETDKFRVDSDARLGGLRRRNSPRLPGTRIIARDIIMERKWAGR